MPFYILICAALAGLAIAPVLRADTSGGPVMNTSLELRTAPGRLAFVREEKNAKLSLEVVNKTDQEIKNVVLSASGEGIQFSQTLPALAASATRTFSIPIPTGLRPGEYSMQVAARSGAHEAHGQYSYRIAPRRPDRLPVLLWGFVDEPYITQQKLLDSGFNRVFDLYAISREDVFKNHDALAADPKYGALQKEQRKLDDALVSGLELAANLDEPTFMLGDKPEYLRVKPDGTPATERPNVLALHPEVVNYSRDYGQSLVNYYGSHPAFTFANIYSEGRDAAEFSFSPLDKAAWKKASGGLDIPAGIQTKYLYEYSKIPDFPKNRVVPDDYPILQYYSWFWKEGDGWVNLLNNVAAPIEKTRPDVTTSFDPALRVASVYGAGGKLDMIGHWTYTNPDPLGLAMTADQLLRMAQGGRKTIGKPHQTFLMMQLFWYRSQTAPSEDKTPRTARSHFDDHDPDAGYITISPDNFREAFWVMLTRPMDMIGYHGQQSLWPSNGTHPYKFTNPQTQHELKKMHAEVLAPLGPTLKKIGVRPNDVAWLESFSSQILAWRGTWGWSSGELSGRYRAALHAGLQPDILYDETIREESLDRYKVLFLLGCDVLTQSVYEKIAAWQKSGGIVIGDKNTCPAIKPDIVVQPLTDEQSKAMDARTDRSLDKSVILAAAQELRTALKGRYSFFASSDDLELLTYARQNGSVDYLFAINDKRKFGDYVGKYGLIREAGESNSGTIRLARNARFAYDLVKGGTVPISVDKDASSLKLDFEPADGRLLALTNQQIGALQISSPPTARAGTTLALKFQLLDTAKKPMTGVWPLQIEIVDAAGREAEWSGFYGAQDGAQEIQLAMAGNDVNGVWTIRATDLAGRKTAVKTIQVTGGKAPSTKEIEKQKVSAAKALPSVATTAPTAAAPVANAPDKGEAITLNSSFENELQGWQFWNSDGEGKFEISQQGARSGNSALLISNLKRGGPYQVFDWKPGRYYAVARLKTRDGQKPKATVMMNVYVTDKKATPGGFENFPTELQTLETGNWQEMKTGFELKNDFNGQAKKVVAILVLDGLAPGEQVTVDDFGVYKLP